MLLAENHSQHAVEPGCDESLRDENIEDEHEATSQRASGHDGGINNSGHDTMEAQTGAELAPNEPLHGIEDAPNTHTGITAPEDRIQVVSGTDNQSMPNDEAQKCGQKHPDLKQEAEGTNTVSDHDVTGETGSSCQVAYYRMSLSAVMPPSQMASVEQA